MFVTEPQTEKKQLNKNIELSDSEEQISRPKQLH